MSVHVPTLFLMIIVISGTLGVSVLTMVRRGQKDGLLFWTGGLMVHALAYLLYSLRGQISDPLSIVGGNAALSATLALLAEGLFQFQQRRPPRRLIWAPVPIVAVLFFLLLDRQAERVMGVSVFTTWQCALALIILMQRRRETAGRGQYYLAAAFTLAIGVFVYRGIAVAAGSEPVGAFAQSDWLQVMAFMTVAIATILIGVGFVIMAKERADARNRFLAQRDELTGLRNRRSLIEALVQQLAQARRGDSPLTVMMIDVDHFKRVNDTHGHLSGDQVLRKTGELIAARTRAQDIPGRFGGEEFLLILPNTAMAGAMQVAEALRQCVATTRFEALDGDPIALTISAGMHEFDPRTDRDCDDLIGAADRALYRAKARGRNRIEVFSRQVPATLSA